MAENYIEILLLGNDHEIVNSYWMNVAIPKVESLHFLEGLLGLIEKRIKSDIVSKCIGNTGTTEHSLFSTFNHGDWISDPRENLVTHSCHTINDDSATLFIGISDQTEKPHGNFFVKGFDSQAPFKTIDINNYENIWIRRWISLFVLNSIAPRIYSERLNKEKLVLLIILTSNKIPGYLKKLAGCHVRLQEYRLHNRTDN